MNVINVDINLHVHTLDVILLCFYVYRFIANTNKQKS